MAQEVVEIEGVIFDLDGTLIDYEGASHVALARPLERRGKDFSWDLHAQIVGTKPEDWSRKIVDAVALDLAPEEYAEEYFHEIHGLYASIPPWPGTLDLLSKLRARGFPLAIATSSPRSSFDVKMTHHPEILAAMTAVVTGGEVTNGKPAPDIFLEAARRIGCDPKKCVVFEDSPLGIQGAHAAGCLAVALPDGRMPSNAGRFNALAPRWLLEQGIGTFEPDHIVPVPPSRGASSGAAATGDGSGVTAWTGFGDYMESLGQSTLSGGGEGADFNAMLEAALAQEGASGQEGQVEQATTKGRGAGAEAGTTLKSALERLPGPPTAPTAPPPVIAPVGDPASASTT